MSYVLRGFMFLGIVLVFIGVISGMGGTNQKSAFSQYMMTAGLISLGLWVGLGLLSGFISKDPRQEIEDAIKAEEAKK